MLEEALGLTQGHVQGFHHSLCDAVPSHFYSQIHKTTLIVILVQYLRHGLSDLQSIKAKTINNFKVILAFLHRDLFLCSKICHLALLCLSRSTAVRVDDL